MAIKFPRYNLTKKQIRGIARIIDCEQGTTAGEHAEASLMANLIDCTGEATVERLIAFVTKEKGNWFAYGRKRYFEGYNGTVRVPDHAIKAVEDCIVRGKRTLPRHIIEHDCLSDIKKVENGKKSDKKSWKRGKTIITNVYGAKWYFWDFPGGYGDDPFGYKPQYRSKWGDFCYTLAQSMDDSYVGEKQNYQGTYPVLPDSSFGVDRKYYQRGDGYITLKNYHTQIVRLQMLLNWSLGMNLVCDGKYGDKTFLSVKKLQEKANIPINGKFGNLCLKYCMELKK